MDIRYISHIKAPLSKSVMIHIERTLHMGGHSRDTPLGRQLLSTALKQSMCVWWVCACNKLDTSTPQFLTNIVTFFAYDRQSET